MSLETCIGPELNIYEETPDHAKRLVIHSPVLSFKKLNQINKNPYFNVKEFDLSFPKDKSLSRLNSVPKKYAWPPKIGSLFSFG